MNDLPNKRIENPVQGPVDPTLPPFDLVQTPKEIGVEDETTVV